MVLVIKNGVILVFNPKIKRIPPKASVKPADQANNSGIWENGGPNCSTNLINQSETSNNSSPINFGVQGVPNLLIASTKDRRYPVSTLRIKIKVFGITAPTLNGIISFLRGRRSWFIGVIYT